MKLAPCIEGKKHSWTHLGDIIKRNETATPTGRRIEISKRGEYRCANCRLIKYGAAKNGL
jgi:hypothetical protein